MSSFKPGDLVKPRQRDGTPLFSAPGTKPTDLDSDYALYHRREFCGNQLAIVVATHGEMINFQSSYGGPARKTLLLTETCQLGWVWSMFIVDATDV